MLTSNFRSRNGLRRAHDVGLPRLPRAQRSLGRFRGEEDRAPAVWRDRHREDSLAELVSEGIAASPLAFVVRAAAALDELEREDAPVEVMFFCVPTPMGVGGIADLAAVEAVIEEIHDVLPAGAVVNKSTVSVWTAVRTVELLERGDVAVVSNPEFLREGSAVQDFPQPRPDCGLLIVAGRGGAGRGAVRAPRRAGQHLRRSLRGARVRAAAARGMPLGGCVLTMGAAHIVRSHARFLTGELLAHYVTWKGRGSVARSDQQSVRARIWVHRPRSSRLHDRSARTTTAVA